MTDSGSMFDGTKPAKIADLMSHDPAQAMVWSREDIAAILQHQLRTPLTIELAGLEPAMRARLRSQAAADGLIVQSMRDLLAHQHPPVDLLRIVKDFAKMLMEHPDSSLPREVCAVLYWACIAAAIVAGGERITSLADAQIREGFDWARSVHGLDQQLAALIDSARRTISPGDVA